MSRPNIKAKAMRETLLGLSPGVGYRTDFLVKRVEDIGSRRTLESVLSELVDAGLYSKSRSRDKYGRLQATFYTRA